MRVTVVIDADQIGPLRVLRLSFPELGERLWHRRRRLPAHPAHSALRWLLPERIMRNCCVNNSFVYCDLRCCSGSVVVLPRAHFRSQPKFWIIVAASCTSARSPSASRHNEMPGEGRFRRAHVLYRGMSSWATFVVKKALDEVIGSRCLSPMHRSQESRSA